MTKTLKPCNCAKWDCITNKGAVCPSHKVYGPHDRKDWRNTADL
jgi:hypothetical protein